MTACPACLRRSWLLATLAGHLDRAGPRLSELLELEDAELISAVGGRRRAELARQLAGFDAAELRGKASAARLGTICRCDHNYPERLRDLPSPPAALYVAGGLDLLVGLTEDESVAVVGTRRPSSYGLDMARGLASSLAHTGVTVISGMAHGIDAAAHEGALAAEGGTIAVLPAGADRPNPASRRGLHRRITAGGIAVSELPPGSDVWRWMFPARNRLIAALSSITVVVEARERSGALLTARWARSLGRPVAAVPGRVTSDQAAGPHELLRDGANLIRSAQDVLDVIYGVGGRTARADRRPELDPELRRWLTAIADGHDTPAALSQQGLPAEQTLQVLSALELSGHIRREAGGRFAVMP